MNENQVVALIDNQITDPITYRYYKCLTNREILLNDYVEDSIVEKVVMPLLEMDNDGTGKQITLYVASAGGNSYYGFLLADVIERIKTPLCIVGMGLAMSMGLLILCSGKNNPHVKRVCYPSMVGLLHAGSINLGNTDANVAKDYMSFNERYEKNVTKAHIIRNTNITDKDYSKYSRKEKYMESKEMLELGFIDEIL
jgi:ATP-dependent Clp protease protease subunit